MNIDQAYLEYENFINKQIAQNDKVEVDVKVEGICICGSAMVIEKRSFWLCLLCGCIEDLGAVVDNGVYRPKKSLYHRRSYFLERMNLLCGYKQSQSPDYKKIVNHIRKHKFKTLRQLRIIMKNLGYNKFYKYIYNIYFDIKNVRHVKINQQRIPRLANEFIIMESFFKQNRDNHMRKNIFSYSVLMYILLKRNRIKGYSKIILPHDHKHLMTNVTKHCSK
jgi:hypothetical protein